MTNKELVRKAVKSVSHYFRLHDIAAATQLTRKQVAGYTAQLEREGVIRRIEQGKYRRVRI